MTRDTCNELRLLIQADMDGELEPAEAARVGSHIQECADCADLQAQLIGVSRSFRQEAPRYRAPEALRAAIAREVTRESVPKASAMPLWRRPSVSFGAGFALAACLSLFVILPRSGEDLSDAVVSAHIRALQPGHLMDVISTDQHTVKPWFDGRSTFIPPVKDLEAEGFPLAGGRLDFIAGRTAAVMIYHRRLHVIDLFAWPGTDGSATLPASGSEDGYNFQRWTQGGMSFWVVSDLNPRELGDFVEEWQKQ